jgi:hypothetical protein
MTRRCKCRCGVELLPAAKCANIVEKKGYASIECLTRHTRIKEAAKKDKVIKKRNNAFKESVRKRTGKGGYYEALKKAIHYYVKHILRKGESCYTCDLTQKFSDKAQSFHVGHFQPAKMVDPRRFMLENLRVQCNRCNVYYSGRQDKYRIRMIEEKGLDHVEWLECESNHKELKEQYPNTDDIKKEISRYNKLTAKHKKQGA